jgi:hypothetical protein
LSFLIEDLSTMFAALLGRELAGTRRKPAAPNAKPKTVDKAQPKPAPPSSDDDLYAAGDICAPEPDRDDEQRDL